MKRLIPGKFVPVFLTVLILLFLFAVLPASADYIPIKSLSLKPKTATMAVGRTYTPKITISPKDATNKRLEWTSSDEEVATVSHGVVTGISPGTVTITATTTDGSEKTASFELTVVRQIEKIGISDKKVLLAPGTIWEQTISVEPENATDPTVKWTSSNTKVATVDQLGVITGVGKGRCVITGAAMDISRLRVTIDVEVGKYDLVILTPGDTPVDIEMPDVDVNGEVTTPRGTVFKGHFQLITRFENGCVERVDNHTLRPVKSGSDTITVAELHDSRVISKKTYNVYVAQMAVRPSASEPDSGSGDESAEILFRDFPWGSTYEEITGLTAELGETMKPLTERNEHHLWSRIVGDLVFGNFKAYGNGLWFYSEKINVITPEANHTTAYLDAASYYFDPDIPFENLLQTVMRVYGLSENETTSGDECVWTVGSVTITLTAGPRYTQLKLSKPYTE